MQHPAFAQKAQKRKFSLPPLQKKASAPLRRAIPLTVQPTSAEFSLQLRPPPHLAVGRVDDGREEPSELAHVPVVLGQAVDVEALGVKRYLVGGCGGVIGGGAALLLGPGAVLCLEPVAVEDVPVSNHAALEDVPGLQRRRLAPVEDQRVALELACKGGGTVMLCCDRLWSVDAVSAKTATFSVPLLPSLPVNDRDHRSRCE